MSETQLAVSEPTKQSTALADFRAAAMAVPAERMQQGLQEYQDRRHTFRDWLLSQLKEGVHYGYPPGLEPKTKLINGVTHYGVWVRGKDGQEGKMNWYPPTQWQAKPSFYKAGADFVCDLMNVVDTYKADMDGWKQLGEPRGTFVYACYLYPKGSDQSPGTLVGEGRGVRKVGTKGGDENNAIKMAKKCSKVDAVLNAYGLADLFVQDLEEANQLRDLHENPEHKSDAPAVKPRAARKDDGPKPVRPDEVKAAIDGWREWRDSRSLPKEMPDWLAFVAESTGRTFNARTASEWTQDDLRKVQQAIDTAQGVPF